MIRKTSFLVLIILLAPLAYAHASGVLTLNIVWSIIPEDVVVSLENNMLVCDYDFDGSVPVIPSFSWYENGLLVGKNSSVFHNPVPGRDYVCGVLLESEGYGSQPKNSSLFAYAEEVHVLWSANRGSTNVLTGFVTSPVRALEQASASSSSTYLPVISLLVILNAALFVNVFFLIRKRK